MEEWLFIWIITVNVTTFYLTFLNDLILCLMYYCFKLVVSIKFWMGYSFSPVFCLVWCPDRLISLHKPHRKPPICCWNTTLFISPVLLFIFPSSRSLSPHGSLPSHHLYSPSHCPSPLSHHQSARLTSHWLFPNFLF